MMKLIKGCPDAGRKIKEGCVLGAKVAWQCHVRNVLVTDGNSQRQQGSPLSALSG
jgi:hypothetical protein